MGLGIGANVTLFTLVRFVLLKPLPFKDPGRLVRLYEHSTDDKFPHNDSAVGIFSEWQKQNLSFTDLAISGDAGYNISAMGGQLPENVRAFNLSWNIRLVNVQVKISV